MTENPENPENPESPDFTREAERRARLTWSLLAEPSDSVALLARERLGPRAALELATPPEQCPIRANLAIAIEREGDLAETGTPMRGIIAAGALALLLGAVVMRLGRGTRR